MKTKSLILSISLVFLSNLNAEDLIINGESVYLAGDQYYDNVIITNGGILYLVEYGGTNQDQGLLRLYCDSLFIDETSSINGDGAGGHFGDGYGGNGGYGSGDGRYSGGGGGGFGGQGGLGGGDIPGSSGSSYGNNNELKRGSRGGKGSQGSSSYYLSGGGGIYIQARIANILGYITSNGENDPNSSSSSYYGRGGGSGGMIWLEITDLTLSGELSVSGGKGWDYSSSSTNGCGGGGGGGRISVMTRSFIDLDLLSATRGEGGDSGNGYPGLDGDDGVIYYLKIWLTSDTHLDEEKNSVNASPVMDMNAVGDIYGYFYEIEQNPNGIADNTSNFTALNSVELDSLADGEWYFHAVPMDSSFNILNEQHMTYHLRINAAPLEIISPTHPNQNYFYDSSNPVFNIETMSGIDEYYYILDENSETVVDETAGTYLPNSQLILPGLSNGTHYLHSVGKDDFGFVGSNTSHFQVNIGPPQATIGISEDSLLFGGVYTTSNSALPITISNMGNGDLEIFSMILSDETNYSVTPASVEPLSEGESANLTITFQPQDTLSYNATLTIQSNDPNNSEVIVNLSGTGLLEPMPEISVEPDSLDFGNIVIGDDSTQTLTIQNLGDSDLIISSLQLTIGTGFSFNPQSIADAIPPDSSESIYVIFSPVNVLNYSDTLIMYSNDPEQPSLIIPLSGAGINPPIQLSIPILDIFANDSISVPVNVEFPNSVSISSFLIHFGGSIQLLDFLRVETESTLLGDFDWTFEVNPTDSLIITASAGADDISGSGILFYMRFHVPDTSSGFILLEIADALFDTGETGFTDIAGGIDVIIPEYGDVDLNGEIQPYDVALILKYLVDYIELDYHQQRNADVSLDNTVSALDASLILQYTVGLIDTLPYSDTTAFFAYGDIGMQDDEIVAGQTVDVPIHLTNGNNILGFEGVVSFNPDHLTYNDIIWTDLLNDFTIEVNAVDGEILIAGAGSLPDGQEGDFAILQFTVNENFENDETTVSVSQLRWNEEQLLGDVATATLTKVMGMPDYPNIPSEFALYQNYPNPFNPITTLRYDLPENSLVNIIIYDLLGREIRTLVNTTQDAGFKSVIWDATNDYGKPVSAGVYLYQIRAGEFVQTRKMVLLK